MISTKNFLITLIAVSFVFVTMKFYSFYTELSEWQYSDWLINYQGGFIRRGFIGEILFKVHKFTSISLDILIFVFVISLYFFLSYFLIKSLKYLENSKINILIFLSPGFFLYPVMNSGVIGRKEILIFFVMGFFVFFEKFLKDKILLTLVILSLFLLSLSHSALLFYTPYIVFLYFLIKFSRYEKVNFLEFLLITVSLFIIFLLISFNHQASIFNIMEICDSVKEFVSENCKNSGQFYYLSLSASEHVSFFDGGMYYKKYSFIYLLSLLAVNLFLGIKLYYSTFKKNYLYLNKINPLIILILLFFLTLPIYILGIDWGRWIYISYSCIFFIYIFCLKNEALVFNESKILEKITPKKFFMILIVFLYSFFLTFPFYNAKNFKLVLKKPINQIIKKLN